MTINKINMKAILSCAKKVGANSITLTAKNEQNVADVIYSCNGGLVKTSVPIISSEGDFSATFVPISSTSIKEDANIMGDACGLNLNGIELSVPCDIDDNADIINSISGTPKSAEISMCDFVSLFPLIKSKYEIFLKFNQDTVSSLKFNEDILSIIKAKTTSVTESFSFGFTPNTEKLIRDVINAFSKNVPEKVTVKMYDTVACFQFGGVSVLFPLIKNVPGVLSGKTSPMIAIDSRALCSYLNTKKASDTIIIKINSGKVVASDFNTPDNYVPIPSKLSKSAVKDISLKTSVKNLLLALNIMENEQEIWFCMDYANNQNCGGKITLVSPSTSKIVIIGSYNC